MPACHLNTRSLDHATDFVSISTGFSSPGTQCTVISPSCAHSCTKWCPLLICLVRLWKTGSYDKVDAPLLTLSVPTRGTVEISGNSRSKGVPASPYIYMRALPSHPGGCTGSFERGKDKVTHQQPRNPSLHDCGMTFFHKTQRLDVKWTETGWGYCRGGHDQNMEYHTVVASHVYIISVRERSSGVIIILLCSGMCCLVLVIV